MSIPETQLETWSHQGSITQSATTYAAIKRELENPFAPFGTHDYIVFLQGSYGNDTNVIRESDVDIVICLTSTFYADIGGLTERERALYEADRTPASYGFEQFKQEVTAWLRQKFGIGVKAGNKAIFVPGDANRRDADVLACARHRRYTRYLSASNQDYAEGICFWTKDGSYIVNFPKQHSENCTLKHQASRNSFKPNVRVLKNMRNAMVNQGYIREGVAPSYFLEGMLWNIPGEVFSLNFGDTFLRTQLWLNQIDASMLQCANGMHWLIRDGEPVCWNISDYQTFLSASNKFWREW
jgi:hypothetical protein